MIGKNVYGGRQIYIFDRKKEEVLLVADTIFALILEADRRLIETRLYDLDPSEIESVEVTAGAKNPFFIKKSIRVRLNGTRV